MVEKKLFQLETGLLCHIDDMAHWKRLTEFQKNQAKIAVDKCFQRLRKIILGDSKDYFSYALNLSKIRIEELLGGINHDISDKKLYGHGGKSGNSRG